MSTQNRGNPKHVAEAKIKILKCSCVHPFQDKIYGKGMRVFNPHKFGDEVGYHCTVCSIDFRSGTKFIK